MVQEVVLERKSCARRYSYGEVDCILRRCRGSSGVGLRRRGPQPQDLIYPALLVVAELGYLPQPRATRSPSSDSSTVATGTPSTVLMSNKGFEEWGRILGDEVLAAAMLDRLLYGCRVVNTHGNSCRMRRHTELSNEIHRLGIPGHP